MDLSRAEQLRDELLKNRRLMITAAIVVVAFFAVTMIGGYLFVRHALDEDRISASAVNTPSQIGLLFNNSASELINHIVYFNDVKIESGPTDDVYFATGAKGHSVLVIATGRKAPDVDNVDIQGTVRPVPTLYTLTKKWKLTKEQAKKVKDQGIYIEAQDIKADRTTSQQRLSAKK